MKHRLAVTVFVEIEHDGLPIKELKTMARDPACARREENA